MTKFISKMVIMRDLLQKKKAIFKEYVLCYMVKIDFH
jgi:hypothetical protein